MATECVCPNCGESFQPERASDIYCSIACGMAHRRAMRAAPEPEELERPRPAATAGLANEGLDRLVGAEHVARYLHVPLEEVERLAHAGDIPARCVGSKWVFSARAINSWLRSTQSGGDQLAEELQPGVEGLALSVAGLSTKIQSITERIQPLLVALPTLPAGRMVADGDVVGFELEEMLPLEAIETAYIRYVLQRCGQNKTRAAEVLGVDPSTLYRKLARLGW